MIAIVATLDIPVLEFIFKIGFRIQSENIG